MRLRVFEGMEDDMVPVADVTDLVMPQIEKAWNDGVKKGEKKVEKKGIKEGVKQAAKGMKNSWCRYRFHQKVYWIKQGGNQKTLIEPQ